jgi:hypothetical protein
MASSQRSRGDEAKDRWVDATGCIELFYPNFDIFVVSGHKGSLVFLLAYKKDQGGSGLIVTSPSFYFAFLILGLGCHDLNFVFPIIK